MAVVHTKQQFLDTLARDRPRPRNPNGLEQVVRYPTVMDLEPSDVPRGGKYFLVSAIVSVWCIFKNKVNLIYSGT